MGHIGVGPTLRELFGCALVFVAVILAKLPRKKGRAINGKGWSEDARIRSEKLWGNERPGCGTDRGEVLLKPRCVLGLATGSSPIEPGERLVEGPPGGAVGLFPRCAQ